MRSSLIIKTTAVSLVTTMLLGVASPAIISATESNGPQTDNSTSVNASEVGQALAYTSGVLSASDQSTTTNDADSAIVAATAGATIDVPKAASDGVTLTTSGGPRIDIQLPNADQAGDATQVAPGVVAYPASNGSANAVQADETGGVRMLTVIDNPKAPTKYDYKVTVPNGGRIELAEDGGARVVSGVGETVASIDTPWAKDANGKTIKTWFTTDGVTLTQYVKHRVRGVVYPVTADPWMHRWYGWDLEFNRRQSLLIATGYSVTAVATMAIPEPTVSKFAGIVLGGMSTYAGWVYNNGGCIKLRVSYIGASVVGHYYGGNCR